MKNKSKKVLSLILASIMLLATLTACGGGKKDATDAGGKESNGTLVGVSMPTKSLQRWNQDGSNMEKSLKKLGYDVEYAH